MLVVLLLKPLDDVPPLPLVSLLRLFIFSVGYFRGLRWALAGLFIDWRWRLLGRDPPGTDDCSWVSWVISSLLRLIDEVVGHHRLGLRSVRLLHLIVGSTLMRLWFLHVEWPSVFFASHPCPWNVRACALQLALQLLRGVSFHKRDAKADIHLDCFILELIEQVENIAPQIDIDRFFAEEVVVLGKHIDVDVARGQHLDTVKGRRLERTVQ